MSVKGLRQQNADLLSALKIAHSLLVQGLGNIEAIEQDCRIAFGRITIFFGDNPFQLAQTHAVFICDLKVRKDTIALLDRFP